MADFRKKMQEIEDALSSSSKDSKALAYPQLLHFQEISAVDSSAMETLESASRSVLSALVGDISDGDEQIAAQALKCLGFMIYHPTIVASIGGDDANAIIQSLVKVIMTTKIKSVCNLGVWCISIQQFCSSLLDQHFQSLLSAIVHALDNPVGSLSTTFEAMQKASFLKTCLRSDLSLLLEYFDDAVVKLANLFTEQMRNMSSLWTPPIYRRLVSFDKRDRDMSERCLLKIMPLICPPPATLSMALASDMKRKLLFTMNELFSKGMKIQSLRAWGLFLRLLGPCALKSKHLLNEMLKIPEQTFADFDSQVQLASLVAWEGLIDALIEPGFQGSQFNLTLGNQQVLRTDDDKNAETDADRCLKRIKLIMAPLIGIMSSKFDVSVNAACLRTWSYLLHKLKASVSCRSIIETVWGPIIEAVFQVGPDIKNILLWNFCLDLLDTLVLGKNKEITEDLCKLDRHQLSPKNTIGTHLPSGKYPLRHYSVDCPPWDLGQLEFFLKVLSTLASRVTNVTVTPEFRGLASDAALRLFGSLLETVQRTLKHVPIAYDDVMYCLSTIFIFLRKMSEGELSEDYVNSCSPLTCLNFLEVATERLEPFILGSPLYKLGLELRCIRESKSPTGIRCPIIPGFCFLDFEDKLIPVVCLSTLSFKVVVNSSLQASDFESLLQQMQAYLKLLFSLYHPQEILHVYISLMYKKSISKCLRIWVVLVNCLRECIDSKNDLEILNMETEIGYSLILHLLSYPFASWSLSELNGEVHIVIETWKLFYAFVGQVSQSEASAVKSISEDLCALINGCIDQITLAVQAGSELQMEENNCWCEFILFCGNIVTCILKQLTLSISSKEICPTDCDGGKSNIRNRMVLTAWFMKLFWVNKERTEPSHASVAARFLSELVNFVRCLHQKEDVIMLVEITSSPLLEWLSEIHLLGENTSNHFQQLWTEILKSMQQLEPPMNFDSSFLGFQEPLLGIALDHQNPAISEPTINFWNSTYGAQSNLEFPETLVPVLDKLFRNGKIKLCSKTQYSIIGRERYKVTTTLKKCSKRAEIVGGTMNEAGHFESSHSGAKRKQGSLTEHQKEVRRAQQGRSRDCSRHGPGIRTYTTVDFSQGNEESQDSPDVWGY